MEVTPELLLRAYRSGAFPMAPDRESLELEWYRPLMRGIIPLDGFHLPRRLARTVLSGRFVVRSDTAFSMVLDGCAETAPRRETTWISPRIHALYTALHALGHAHSVEVWREGRLIGGLYGVSLGGAFFGESMFSRETDASKVAFVHLVATMRRQGYALLDAQYATAHLERFGCREIPARTYEGLLHDALGVDAQWSTAVGLGVLEGNIRQLAGAPGEQGQGE